MFAPYGVMGGQPGALATLTYQLQGEAVVPPLKSKAERIAMRRGDRVTVQTPGGGGYGQAGLRAAQARATDRLLGYTSS